MKKRRVFTPEFKAEAVQLCKAGDRSIAQVAKDLGIPENPLRNWVKLAEAAPPSPPVPEALSAVEREELLRLRKQVKRLEMERDILKKATAFFARESE